MINDKGGDDRLVDWIWRLSNMAFDSGIVPEDWRADVIVLLHKGKTERTECRNFRAISLLSVVGKNIYITSEQGEGGQDGLESDVRVDGIRLDYVSEIKCF